MPRKRINTIAAIVMSFTLAGAADLPVIDWEITPEECRHSYAMLEMSEQFIDNSFHYALRHKEEAAQQYAEIQLMPPEVRRKYLWALAQAKVPEVYVRFEGSIAQNLKLREMLEGDCRLIH